MQSACIGAVDATNLQPKKWSISKLQKMMPINVTFSSCLTGCLQLQIIAVKYEASDRVEVCHCSSKTWLECGQVFIQLVTCPQWMLENKETFHSCKMEVREMICTAPKKHKSGMIQSVTAIKNHKTRTLVTVGCTPPSKLHVERKWK